MEMNLKGKLALVCGGSQGIGLASAQELALLGAKVTLVSRSTDKLKKALNTLAGTGHNFIEMDLQHDELPSDLDKRGPYSILVNNAGGPAAGPLLEVSIDSLLEGLKAHLFSSHRLAQILVPQMKSLGEGRIINIISTSVKAPLPGLGMSNTIRGAVGNWVKSLAHELGPYNITVNAVLPGATSTERLQNLIVAKSKHLGVGADKHKEHMLKEIPLGRFADPHEVGRTVAFLASPWASYISGVALAVDGGRTPCF